MINMAGRLISCASREELWRDLAADIAADLAGVVSAKGRASMALPGGTTPGPLFDCLSQMDSVPWRAVTVMPTDERYVAKDDASSNERLLRERLLVGPAAAARLISFHAEAEWRCRFVPAESLPLDICILGLGEDGHFASLIAGAHGFTEAMAPDAPALVGLDAPNAAGASLRTSLSFREIVSSRRIMLVFLGEAKRAVFASSQLEPLASLRARVDIDAYWSA